MEIKSRQLKKIGMAISISEAAVGLALTASNAIKGKPTIAMAINIERGENLQVKIVAIAQETNRTEYDSQSAVINLLQNQGNWNKPKSFNLIAVSKAPSEGSYGMARLVNLLDSPKIVYPENGVVVVKQWCPNPNTPKWETSTPKGNDLLATTLNFEKLTPHLSEETASEWFEKQEQKLKKETPESRLFDTFNDKQKSIKKSLPDKQRYSFEVPPDILEGLKGIKVDRDSMKRKALFMALAWAVLQVSRVSGNKSVPNGNNVACVLRGPNDEIMGWGVNTGSGNKRDGTGIPNNSLLHGEVNAIQAFKNSNRGEAFKSDTQLYTTLQSCYMCAGMYVESGESLKCYYGLDDPGIKNSALNRTVKNEIKWTLDIESKLKKEYDRLPSRMGITTFLNGAYLDKNAAMKILNLSLSEYLKLKSGSPTTDDYKIWLAGLKLLHFINPTYVSDTWKEAYPRAPFPLGAN